MKKKYIAVWIAAGFCFATSEAVQIAASTEFQFDGLAVGFTGAGTGTALWRCSLLQRKSAHFVWLEGAEVGDHLRVGKPKLAEAACDCYQIIQDQKSNWQAETW